MQKISPFLWFDGQAEATASFYVSLFKNSKITNVSRYGEAGPGPAGSVMSVSFQLEGQEFHALNGGPHFTFSPAISLFVDCQTQEEVDTLWEKLSEGGKPLQCGWITDRFGVTWQIVPSGLLQLLHGPDAQKSASATKAMMQMIKLDLAKVREAYERG